MKRDLPTANLPTCGGFEGDLPGRSSGPSVDREGRGRCDAAGVPGARQGREGSPWPPDYAPPEPRPALPPLFTFCEVALVAAILAALAIFVWAWSA